MPAPPRRPERRPHSSAARRTTADGPVERRAAGGTAEPRLRMRDLVRETGLPRETIHFYKAQGLLPEPIKTGRNTAVYSTVHVERLRRIRELQERQFLPLKAIRAILQETDETGFTPEQEGLVRRVRATLAGWASAQQRPTVAVADFVPDRVTTRELRELVAAGIVSVERGPHGGAVSEDDAVILECWAQFKEAGLGPEQGVTAGELRIYDEAMERLVAREARLALRTRGEAAPEELSRTVEAIGPVIGRLLAAMHRKRMRRFLAEFDGADDSGNAD
ncbi:MAG: MerR family transcriptional regulator [Lysobacterales bacterium]|nr:MAG: MerR family transcriptional regulator [Xanthomonadales bacterium]